MKLSQDFSVIVQQDGRPPRHFNVNRFKAKTFFILFPLTVIILFLTLGLIFVYFSALKTQFYLEKPSLMKKHQKEKLILNNKIDILEQKNKKLTSDLIFNDSFSFSSNQFVRVLPTSKDRSAEQVLSIDGLKLKKIEGSYKVSFNISNQSVVNRVSGYFFTILKDENIMQFFPQKIGAFKSVSFKNGEYFSTSRFRPVAINFQILKKIKKPEIITLVYSKNGDLLHSSSQIMEALDEQPLN